MRIRYALVTGAAVLALAACGNDSKPSTGGASTERAEHTYTPGMTVDSEDYAGPAQAVTGHDHEDAEYGTRTKRVSDGTETYCKTRKNGRCTSSGTRTKYKNVPERYEKDDADWYLVLADGTRVDVEQGDQARYPVGATYP